MTLKNQHNTWYCTIYMFLHNIKFNILYIFGTNDNTRTKGSSTQSKIRYAEYLDRGLKYQILLFLIFKQLINTHCYLISCVSYLNTHYVYLKALIAHLCSSGFNTYVKSFYKITDFIRFGIWLLKIVYGTKWNWAR